MLTQFQPFRPPLRRTPTCQPVPISVLFNVLSPGRAGADTTLLLDPCCGQPISCVSRLAFFHSSRRLEKRRHVSCLRIGLCILRSVHVAPPPSRAGNVCIAVMSETVNLRKLCKGMLAEKTKMPLNCIEENAKYLRQCLACWPKCSKTQVFRCGPIGVFQKGAFAKQRLEY